MAILEPRQRAEDTTRPDSHSEDAGVIEVTSKPWKTDLLDSQLPVVVDFYTGWCGPCQYVRSIIEQLFLEFSSIVKFARIDVDKNPDIANR